MLFSSTFNKSQDISSLQTFQVNHCYQLRLQTDEEMLAKAECTYTDQLLKSKEHTLDSALFGATVMNPVCSICFQRVEACPGHFSVVKLPFPIVKTICLKDFKMLLPLICPICSHFYIKNVKDALALNPEDRLPWIKEQSLRFTKGEDTVIVCSNCHQPMVPIKIVQNEPCLRCCIVLPQDEIYDHINPCALYTILQNFRETEEAGFSTYYHPKDFMTTLLPIVPAKLRPKTMIASESTLTSYYKVIIEEIIPELNKLFKQSGLFKKNNIVIPRGDFENVFNKFYDKLVAYYLLITDMGTDTTKEQSLDLIEKRDRKHVDIHNSMIGRFRDKDKSYFNKGVIATRHNASARSVLGGAVNSPIKCVNVPSHVASKLAMAYPVFEENLKIMQQLVAAMANPVLLNDVKIPRVIGIVNGLTGKTSKLHYKDAATKAALLKPGDEILISLMNGDFVMQSRFPAVREESFNSMQVHIDDNTIITLPLATLALKMADFDGDEGQIYVITNHCYDIEALLLHSTFAQYIEYKSGNPGIWYPSTGDAYYGLKLIKKGAKAIVRNENYVPEYNVIDVVNSFLPKDLNYSDSKLCIKDGKIVDTKTGIKNMDFFKYYASLYSNEKAEELMDNLSQLCYDLLLDQGASLGYEIKIYGNDVKQKVRAIVKETEKKMFELEKSNNPLKDALQPLNVNNQKSEIKQLIIDSAKNSRIGIEGYTQDRQEEYYQTVVMLDHIICDGTRIRPILAEGSRVANCFPRYTIDPRAYGYADRGYADDIPPYTHFYDCKQQRFSMFQKGQGTAEQGYVSKRLAVTYGTSYTDFNGAVVNNFRNISTVYNCCGLNPRLFVNQPLIDIQLSRDEFKKKYDKEDDKLLALYDSIHDCQNVYAHFTCFTTRDAFGPEWIAGFNYEQYINSYTEEGKTDRKTIETFIDNLKNIFKPKGLNADWILENFKSHEYYFRVKLLQHKCNKEVLDKLTLLFEWSLCDGGDAVGMKASLACSEPLTQASLHAIHHASGGGVHVKKIKQSEGVDRFEELLGGNKNKNTVLTFVLYDDSEKSSIDFANEQETFYFNNIWSRMELDISKKIHPRILKQHSNLNLNELDINPYYITSIWNLSQISAYHIHVCDVINKLIENYNEIMFISGWILNSTEFMAYIYFKPTVQAHQIQIIMEEWGTERPSTIVHGKYLKNCYVTENKNRPGHFIIQANEVNERSHGLENLIFDERVDPYGCKTSDPNVMIDMFGVMETAARDYEELIYTALNLSDTRGVLQRHYKVLADSTFAGGDSLYANRSSLRHDRTIDIMRLVQFETAKDMIQQSLKFGDIQPIADPVSASFFGELPSFGTGVSKCTIYME